MPNTRLLEMDSGERSRTLFHEDGTDGSIVIAKEADVEDVVEQNKALMALSDGGTGGRDGMGTWVASIPTIIWEDLMRRGIAQDNKKLLRWLDDRDNLLFRTNPMKLSR